MMDLPIPEAFKKACRNLGQDLEYEKPTLDYLAQIALIGIEHHEYPAIKTFLDELLSGRYSAEQLKEFWWSTPADIYFHEPHDLVTFLKLLRSTIEKTP